MFPRPHAHVEAMETHDNWRVPKRTSKAKMIADHPEMRMDDIILPVSIHTRECVEAIYLREVNRCTTIPHGIQGIERQARDVGSAIRNPIRCAQQAFPVSQRGHIDIGGAPLQISCKGIV